MPVSEQKDSCGSIGGEPVTAKELIASLARQIEKTVRDRPLISVAVAAATGYLLASFTRR